MSVADPVMLAKARQSRGLTQAQLARRTGQSQAFISKAEAGQVSMEGDRLREVADNLGYPVPLLCVHADAYSLTSTCAFHRKRNALPVSKARQVHAILDIARLQAEELLRDVPSAPVRLHRIQPDANGIEGPREISFQVREALGLPKGPIDDLTRVIEAAGVIVLSWDIGHHQGDAVSQWSEGHRPAMLLYRAAPGDRLRFSVAHELGHLIMHTEPVDQQEEQADQFASELLLPGALISAELEDLDMAALARLKLRWGVSMAALIRRAHDLGAISSYRYRELNIELSKAGWRTHEPVEIPTEHPAALAEAVSWLKGKGLDDGAIAERGLISVDDLKNLTGCREAA